jgi:molybdopterin-containing oxidoreductase family iron-sulfur binding subunit
MSAAKTPDRRWWRSLGEYADSESFGELIRAEFPSLFELWRVDRRELLRVMGASLAFAGITGCKPAKSDDAVPFVNQPEGFLEGRVAHYATAVLVDGFAQPVLATTAAGRPIKLEGNPQHPASGGATSFLAQAALLDLYDPDRSQAPLFRGSTSSWADFDGQMGQWRNAWAKSGGAGLRLLIGPTTSPTLIRQIQQLKAALPNLRVHGFDPLIGYAADPLHVAANGPVQLLLRLDNARVVVSLDDDFLGPGPAQVMNARGWAKRRGDASNAERIRLFMAEPSPTLTGANAQHRIGVRPSRMPLLAAAIAARLGSGPTVTGLTPAEFGWVNSAADALLQSRGASLLAVGRHSPPELHALALQLNQKLGNTGRTIEFLRSVAGVPDGNFVDLARDIQSGQVAALFMLDANPVYAAPGDIDFIGLLGRVPLKVHAGTHVDETATASDWHLPLPHALEDWSDARSVDGLATIIQPVIRPLYDTRSIHSILAGFTTEATPPDARVIVRAAWPKLASDDPWNTALKLGFVPGTESAPAAVSSPAAPIRIPTPKPQGAIEIAIRPDPTIRDGRSANNGWLQELPKPLTKVTWDNVIAISPALAKTLGIGESGEPEDDNTVMIEVDVGGATVAGPVWVMPGHPDGVATVYLGYGRKHVGHVGEAIGYDAYPLRTMTSPWSASGSIRATAIKTAIATTQTHHLLEGGEEVPSVPNAGASVRGPMDQQSIYPKWPQDEPAWGMVIDTDLCIGCNACISACQAENNVPVVGKKQVYMGREMHWLRVSRLYSGEPDNPATAFQPIPCMQCEQAPCEMGCPVHATVHSPDGLNLMVYNRCIGTRTCSSYCPYKVRRFNWFDYTTGAAPSIEAQRNPDVTVRGRGVMEKCTYCIQRIRSAAVAADIDNRAIADGEVKTACQQACPTNAIVFGNLADAGSAVAKRRASPRNYALLEELGTRPRTTYLARIEEDDA